MVALLRADLAHSLGPMVASGPAPPTETAFPIVIRGGGLRMVGPTARAHTTGPGVIQFPDAATAAAFVATMDGLPVVPFVPHQPALRAATPFPLMLRVAHLAAPFTQATGPMMVDQTMVTHGMLSFCPSSEAICRVDFRVFMPASAFILI